MFGFALIDLFCGSIHSSIPVVVESLCRLDELYAELLKVNTLELT